MSLETGGQSLVPFFAPNAVAVVGASRDSESIGYRILDELVRAGFCGSIYPVNPKASTLCGIKAYPSVRDLPERVDLAVVAVPPGAILTTVDDCAANGVRAVVVVTAGFSEAGAAGRELQQRLAAKVRGYGMRMIGPNCMGLVNTDPAIRLNASFSPLFPPAGPLAMSSQSGAVGLAVMELAAKRRLGLSTFVSVGNKADVSGNDLIEYWENDPATRVILLYLESFGNPRRFATIARRVGRLKPIVAVKAGRSGSGLRAAGSHTAALAASDRAVDALFRQTGVIRAETFGDLFDIAATLGRQPLVRGRSVGIVTNAGGPGILCADACEAGGLLVPSLDTATQTTLQTFLPATANCSNPVDMIASAGPEAYARTIEVLLSSSQVDALVVIHVPLDRHGTQTFELAMCKGVDRGRSTGGEGKPVLVCVMPDGLAEAELTTPSKETLPVYGFPETAAKVLARCAEYSEWKASPPGLVPELPGIHVEAALAMLQTFRSRADSGWLSGVECQELLDAFGIRTPLRGFARTAAEAVATAQRIGFPVALKLASTKILHKSEVHGVQLGLSNADAVERAFERIRDALAASNQLDAMDGVLVQQMIAGGVEVMAGVATDPSFGPLVAFGLGGVHVEVLGDVTFRLAPLTDRDVEAMIRGIRGHRLLEGYRGHPAADVEAIRDVLLRLSRMVTDLPDIDELDMNPIISKAPGEGCLVLDARIHISSPGKLNT
jgi:acetyl coenzyme A synthetase (ADP forming)-like protein